MAQAQGSFKVTTASLVAQRKNNNTRPAEEQQHPPSGRTTTPAQRKNNNTRPAEEQQHPPSGRTTTPHMPHMTPGLNRRFHHTLPPRSTIMTARGQRGFSRQTAQGACLLAIRAAGSMHSHSISNSGSDVRCLASAASSEEPDHTCAQGPQVDIHMGMKDGEMGEHIRVN
jgi:hypothetical protein